jgi:hypothetical protein
MLLAAVTPVESTVPSRFSQGRGGSRHRSHLLGLSFWETEAFLKKRQAYLAYADEDLEQDRSDLGRAGLA